MFNTATQLVRKPAIGHDTEIVTRSVVHLTPYQSSKWTFPMGFSHQNSICILVFPIVPQTQRPSNENAFSGTFLVYMATNRNEHFRLCFCCNVIEL